MTEELKEDINNLEDVSDSGQLQNGGGRPFLNTPIPDTIMGPLLHSLGIHKESGEITQACKNAQKSLGSVTPGKRCKAIFNELELRGVQVAQMHWRRFDQRRLPAIIFHENSWFICRHAEAGGYEITDESGISSPIDDSSLANSLVLWIRRLEKKEDQTDKFSVIDNSAARLVLGEVFKSKRWLREVCVASVIVNLLAVCTSLFAMQVYDRVVPTLAYSTLYTLVAGMAIVLGMSWILKIIRSRILDSLSCEVDQTISRKVYDHIMHLQLDTRPRSLGTLAAQVSGLDTVRQFFTSSVVFALIDMPFALMFIAFIAFIGGPIAWVYILLLPIAVALGIYTQRKIRGLMRQQMIRSNERQGMLVDAIQGSESIRSNNATWRFSEEWQDITRSIAEYNVQQRAVSNFTTSTTATLASAAYVLALVVGVGQIAEGNLTMGALIACSILGGRVIAPIAQAVQYLAQWQSVVQSLQMVSAVLNLPSERPANKDLLTPEEIPHRIDLEELTFSYPDSPIKHINIDQLNLKAGDRVVLLGPIGSGKSTLLKVLGGLYKPSHGRIRHGLADLWEIDPNVISSYLAYLPQNVHLFKGTLRSNILMAGAVNDSMFLKTCKLLGIDQIAGDSPQGMDLPIAEGGDGMSGGQRQLVGLARLFLSKPKIWLLDEPTSSLDNISEERVIKALNTQVGPKDILVIATHRPMLAKRLANRVLVMRRGEIVSDGTPDKILNNEGGLNQQAKQAFLGRGKHKGPSGNC